MKGGIISVSIYLFIAIISLIEVQINYGNTDMGTAGYWIIILLGILLVVFYEKIFFFVNFLFYNEAHPGKSELLPLVVFILLNAVVYFFIGAAIGLLVGKIKARKKS